MEESERASWKVEVVQLRADNKQMLQIINHLQAKTEMLEDAIWALEQQEKESTNGKEGHV